MNTITLGAYITPRQADVDNVTYGPTAFPMINTDITFNGNGYSILLRKVLKPRLIAIFVGVVAMSIVITGYLFNLVI